MSLDILIFFGGVLFIFSLPGTVEIFMLTVFGNLTPPKLKSKSNKLNICVVIPAHDEELNVVNSIKSLFACEIKQHQLTVVVIADNCSDNTAVVAKDVGARVLERTNLKCRGKGAALNFAFQALMKERFDAYIILDADTVVQQNFIVEFAKLFQAGADAVQCRYLVANPDASLRTRLMNLALLAMHVLRPRGRSQLGISCGVFGNGFGLTRQTLIDVPYLADSVVEDLEYHISLVRAEKTVVFANQTTVWAEFPAGGKSAETQRSRWEGGRLRIIRENAFLLFKKILKGDFYLIEPLLELLTLPLAFHATLLCLMLLIPNAFLHSYAVFSFGVIGFYILSAIYIAGSKKDLIALLGVPFYIIWKITKLGRILQTSDKNTKWVRTARK